MACGVPSCGYRAKQYGVCGVHKQWAYSCNDAQFIQDMHDYASFWQRMQAEVYRLAREGINIPRRRPYPPELQTYADMLEELVPRMRALQAKYDPDLAFNAGIRIRHAGTECKCKYCSLGGK